MWAFSSFFNVAIITLALAVLPLSEIYANNEVLLAKMGYVSSGYWLEVLVCVDAFMELVGAVLTSYIGINGLVQRLAIDRVLPRVLLQKNAWRLTNHYIFLAYFVVASSLVLVLNGQISELSGVFSFAFLGVITSFIIGCLLLKIEREEMPRAIRTSWTNLLFCLVMIVLGIIANALSNLTPLGYFALYFAAIGFVVLIMLERVRLLKAVLYVSKQVQLYFKYTRRGQSPPASSQNLLASSSNFGRNHGVIGSVFIAKTIERIKKTPVIFFCKRPNLPKINEAVSYVIHNEQTYCLRLVHICAKNDEIPREFEDIVSLFDQSTRPSRSTSCSSRGNSSQG